MTEKMFYMCDICKKFHDTKEECEKCESSHTSVKSIKECEYIYDGPYPYRINIEFADGTVAAYDLYKILQEEVL
ncbi:MAG: hypothetical protein LUE29_09635 [Lachnospiraceae bacterium]|nr:hypothetical protein [Lachnospiraceae bacterium]